MAEETIKKVLKNLDLTEKEAEVYIFLSKHGVLKCGEIAKGMKRHKAQIYRILKILQTKGLLESTLEAPTRFTAVPFETVLDLSIKAKRDEAAQMETTKNEILTYWKSIYQPILAPPLGKFVIIEGNHKIYPKIAQMIKDAKIQLSAVATVSGLARADQFGIFNAIFTHPLRFKIQFRFLADLSSQNLDAMKTVLKRIPENGFNLKGRTPELGLQTPRMVIRDGEEILFFITPKPDAQTLEQEVCLWTDSKELVQSFSAVFEDFWRNSTDIEHKIAEIESGNTSQRIFISSAKEAKETYQKIIGSAKKQIIMLTSAQGLMTLYENTALTAAWIKKGISVKIMAPITSENLKNALRLSETCPVRHIPSGYLQTTVVDEMHLFQFTSPYEPEKLNAPTQFENTFYTSEHEHVKRIRLMLNSVWKGASIPSATYVDSLSSPQPKSGTPEPGAKFTTYIKNPPTKYSVKSRSTVGNAQIYPPNHLDIPAMIISAFRYEKESAFGEGNSLYINVRLKTPRGYNWVPVAALETNKKSCCSPKSLILGYTRGK